MQEFPHNLWRLSRAGSTYSIWDLLSTIGSIVFVDSGPNRGYSECSPNRHRRDQCL